MGRTKVKKKINKKKIKKNKNNITKIVIIFLLAVIIVLVCFGIDFLRTNEKFNVQNIEVYGNAHYTAEDICTASGIVIGTNLFELTKSTIKENLSTLPYIKEVQVSRNLPDTIKLKVIERSICYAAYAKDTGEYVLLDEEGFILSKIDNSELKDKLLIFGLNFDDNIILGDSLTEIELEKLNSFTNIYNIYVQSGIDMKITGAEFKGAKIILTLNNIVNVIMVDNSEIEYKVRLLKSVLEEVEVNVACQIDLTLDNPTYSLIVN